MMIGTSRASGHFTEQSVVFADTWTQFPPEAKPADLTAWTDGQALITTTYVVGRVNDALLYPFLGLGALVSPASKSSGGIVKALR